MRKYFRTVSKYIIEYGNNYLHLGCIVSWKVEPSGRDKWQLVVGTMDHVCHYFTNFSENEAREMAGELVDYINTYEEELRK